MRQESEPQNYRNVAYYAKGFAQLNVYRGEALNKPILLLSVIDLINQGLITDREILISDELIETFKKYWSLLGVGPFKSSQIVYPFFHLKNDPHKFWHLQFTEEYQGGRPQSIRQLKHDIALARLDQQLFELLQNSASRQELIDALISSWFASKSNQIEDILQVNQEIQESADQIDDSTEEGEGTPKKFNLRKSLVRDALFRKAVVHLYDYKCAICRLKVTKSLTQNIVDGAHIKPFAIFNDNKVDNGISFCKNHHWGFDRGCFGIDENYRIIVADDFIEESPYSKPIKDFEGDIILLPSNQQYLPRIEALQWHLNHVLNASQPNQDEQ